MDTKIQSTSRAMQVDIPFATRDHVHGVNCDLGLRCADCRECSLSRSRPPKQGRHSWAGCCSATKQSTALQLPARASGNPNNRQPGLRIGPMPGKSQTFLFADYLTYFLIGSWANYVGTPLNPGRSKYLDLAQAISIISYIEMSSEYIGAWTLWVNSSQLLISSRSCSPIAQKQAGSTKAGGECRRYVSRAVLQGQHHQDKTCHKRS